jgi:hypothetical protein
MAYCTQAHVEGEFKDNTFTVSTSVTIADVARFIEETDAEIDSKIGRKYVVPVTGATSILLLRMISVTLVSERIKKIIAIKAGDSKVDQDAETTKEKTVRKMLESIVKGEMILSDATLVSSGGGVRSYTYENDIESVFDVTQDQW